MGLLTCRKICPYAQQACTLVNMSRDMEFRQENRVPEPTPLRAWLDATGTSRYALAKELNCDPKLVKRWTEGVAIPHLVYAFKLEQATQGGVPVASWLGTTLGRELWARMGIDFRQWRDQVAGYARRKSIDGAP